MGECVAMPLPQPVEIGTTQGPINSEICGWKPPAYGDAGYSAFHLALSAVAFAVAVWSAYEQMRIFNMRYQLANAYADIAQETWDRFDARYRPLENQMINICIGEVAVVPDYEAARGTYSAFVERGRSAGDQFIERELAGLCPGAARFRAYEVDTAAFGDDMLNLAYRDAERDALDMDDARWSRRNALLNLGRDLSAQSASYGNLAGGILANAAQLQASATAGAAHFLGYIRNRS